MKKLKIIKKDSNRIILLVCYIVIFSCLSLIIILLIKDYKINRINNLNIDIFFEKNEEDKQVIDNEQVETVKNDNNNFLHLEKYLGVLEIRKINLYRGFYDIDSKLNDINKNIYLIKESKMPNVINGNLILASHSGNSSISFFKFLYKLEINDIATIYYNDNSYDYRLVKIYEVLKNGKVFIKRNSDVNTLTLITCKQNTDMQLVFIFELENIGGERE